MIEQHPITPPLELIKHWEEQHFDEGENYDVMLIQAYQAGADRELEACCKWVDYHCSKDTSLDLHIARRPKPPSLKEQALETLKYPKDLWSEAEVDTIRRALDALPDD